MPRTDESLDDNKQTIIGLDEDVFDIGFNVLKFINEAKLSKEERTDYGLPKKKKYPMPDEAHVLQAIRMFNHCDPEDEAELARNIKKYMKKYNMKDVKVGKGNRFYKYYHPEDHKEKKKPIEESQMTSKRNIFLTSAGLENDEVRQMFLSSYGKSIKKSKVLYVTAAAVDKESIAYLDECWRDLLNIGINPDNIIEYNFDKDMDYDDFMKFDIVYICGGDENHLIQVINKSGMRDNFILAINNGLVYIGVSAGACIASPYVDNGLNFIPNKVDVHYSKKESTRNGSLPPKHVQINLSNDQAIWINGNNAKIIGRSKDEINNEAYLYTKSVEENGTYQDTVFVYNRLSDKEKSLLGRHHVDSPACVYRKVEYNNDTPIGWIELYDSSKVAMMTNQEYDENIKDLNIGIAVDKEFRGKGIATKLLKNAIQFFKSSQYETLTYIVRDGNYRSEAFAKKCGFAYMWKRKKEHETVYMITNPSKMRNAINEDILSIGLGIRAFVNESVRISEMSGGGGPMIGLEINDQSVQYSSPGCYIINYQMKNTFADDDGRKTDYAVTNDIYGKYIYRKDKKTKKYIKEEAKTFLEDKPVQVYKFTGDQNLWYCLMNDILMDVQTEDTLYEYLSNKREITEDQIHYDDSFEFINPYLLEVENSMLEASIDNYNNKIYEFIVNEEEFKLFNEAFKIKRPFWLLMEDVKGYFIYDMEKDLRSKSFNEETLKNILIV